MGHAEMLGAAVRNSSKATERAEGNSLFRFNSPQDVKLERKKESLTLFYTVYLYG